MGTVPQNKQGASMCICAVCRFIIFELGSARPGYLRKIIQQEKDRTVGRFCWMFFCNLNLQSAPSHLPYPNTRVHGPSFWIFPAGCLEFTARTMVRCYVLALFTTHTRNWHLTCTHPRSTTHTTHRHSPQSNIRNDKSPTPKSRT